MEILTNVFLLFLFFSSQAAAWGEHGHRTVAYLARMYFSDAAENLYNELMQPTDTFDISDGAEWPDQRSTQGKMPWSKPWHYIDAKDNPPKTCKINYNVDCDPDKECVIAAIKNMTSRVNDASLDKSEQNIAFKFLLHFLGDVTQPLHTESKCRGGNNILVQWGTEKREEKLHEVWDTHIIKKLVGYKQPRHADPNNVYDKSLSLGWATQLKARNDAMVGAAALAASECVDISTPEKCALAWAGEANKFVCSYVLKDGENLGPDQGEDDCQWEWHGPEDVSLEYYDGAVPIVEEQIAKAGYRLGQWINALADERASMKRMGVNFDDGKLLVQEEL